MVMTDFSYYFNAMKSTFSFTVESIEDGCVNTQNYIVPMKEVNKNLIELCKDLIREKINLYFTITLDDMGKPRKLEAFNANNDFVVFSIQIKDGPLKLFS